jgi:hypothetical protein
VETLIDEAAEAAANMERTVSGTHYPKGGYHRIPYVTIGFGAQLTITKKRNDLDYETQTCPG